MVIFHSYVSLQEGNVDLGIHNQLPKNGYFQIIHFGDAPWNPTHLRQVPGLRAEFQWCACQPKERTSAHFDLKPALEIAVTWLSCEMQNARHGESPFNSPAQHHVKPKF